MLGVELLVIIYLTSWGTAKLFSTETAPFYIYILNSHIWGFQFLHILASTCYFHFCFLFNSHLYRYEVVFTVILHCISQWLMMLSILKLGLFVFYWDFPCGSASKKNLPAMWETWVRSLGWEDPTWRRERLLTPVFWPGEFHGLYSPCGHKRVGHNWATFTLYKYYWVVEVLIHFRY